MSTHRKEDFWIGAKGGLIEWKHYKRMRSAVWLFLHLLRCQTALSSLGEGMVYYGHPLKLDSIRRETCGIPVRTLKAWVIRLREQGYIRTEDHGCRGLVFWIANGKHKTKKATVQRVAATIPQKSQVGFGHISVPIDGGVVPKTARIAARAGQEYVPIETPERRYLNEPAKVAAESISRISKDSISTNLSNHNKAAAAQTAASPTFLLNEKSKVKSKPQHPDPRPTPKPVDAPLRDWQDRHAERDPALAEYRKAHGL